LVEVEAGTSQLLPLLLLLPQLGVLCGDPLGPLPPPEGADWAQRRVLKEQPSEVQPTNGKNSVLRRNKSLHDNEKSVNVVQ
jgi:hypothetical protein